MEDIPFDRVQEIEQMQLLDKEERLGVLRRSDRLQNRVEPRDIEVAALEASAEPAVVLEWEKTPEEEPVGDLTVFQSRRRTDVLEEPPAVDDVFLSIVKKGYEEDSFFKKILGKPADFRTFEMLSWGSNHCVG
ncbi:hypothetical protein DFH07DRAFT_767408 [Mycena maculata]|uniref:Uncharacterized protein n=1 Tax=Mycena maculata TaxID=230809 RepID=A0AAD7JY51_9AGAR|nr:hypothetical protein DFH07DRAFT_767408 [Mycena maculata]